MPLNMPRYRVLLAPGCTTSPASEAEPTEHEVTIMNGDQLRAELEGPRHGLTSVKDAPMHFTTLWAWASLSRTHVYDKPFMSFKDDCLALEPLEDPAAPDPDAADLVDPTQPGPATVSP